MTNARDGGPAGAALAPAGRERSLHELEADRKALLDEVEAAGGEFGPEQEARLEALDAAILGKVDAYGWVVSRLEKEAELFTERARALAVRARSRLAMAGRLRERMAGHLASRGLRKLEGDDYTVYLSEAETVVIECDPALLPAAFLRPRESEPDRDGLRRALKEGRRIHGVRLERTPYVTIR
jgi:hypothetical protein